MAEAVTLLKAPPDATEKFVLKWIKSLQKNYNF